MDKRPMKTINLKKYYYPICKKDTFVEVPDEVADAIAEESRAENANDAKQHYHCYRITGCPQASGLYPLGGAGYPRRDEAAHPSGYVP